MGPPFRLDDLDAFGDRRANRHRRMGWFPSNTPQWTVRRGDREKETLLFVEGYSAVPLSDSRVIGIVNQLEDHTCKDWTGEPMREQVDDGCVLLRLPYYTRKKGTGAGREVDCNFP
ncbi:hypothetical protein BHE74_00042552 [Ensete ventricosum]|nr:hypothetical protein BHE74_00042552 [Ensete ventricosum]